MRTHPQAGCSRDSLLTSHPPPCPLQDLLRSALPDSMEAALGGDERCVLDTMRLVDLLLVLLFEGRKALPKSTAGSTGRIPGLRRLDSSGERSHRQLIDCIRSKDTDALIDAIDTGGKTATVTVHTHTETPGICAQLPASTAAFEVNFMDDVGQTLLNWASAFGTQEMVRKAKRKDSWESRPHAVDDE